jgi:hypothetical protein
LARTRHKIRILSGTADGFRISTGDSRISLIVTRVARGVFTAAEESFLTPKQHFISTKSLAQGEAPPVAESSAYDHVPNVSLALTERIRGILSTKNLTLYKVSALTRANHLHERAYHIPRNFYFQLRSAGWTPTLSQLFALSQVSGYRLLDWLSVFGFRMDAIPCLQTSLHHPRTTLLDSAVYDARAPIPWFRDRFTRGRPPAVAPLSQLLEASGERRVASLVAADPDPYLYAKIGRQDAFAFPDLIPGSIVRVNPRFVDRLASNAAGEISKHIFLVEHSHGVCCCRLYFGTKNRVTLTATQLPFANVELQVGSEARIHGVLDMELRPLATHRRMTHSLCTPPEVAPDLSRLWTPGPFQQEVGTQRPALLLQSARRRAGLSLRRASEMSRAIATALRDKRYFASPGWLSDFEASGVPPRHIHKLLTVCILYSVRFAEILNSFGLERSETATASIPDQWMPRRGERVPENQETNPRAGAPAAGFFASLLQRFGDVPFFLRHSLPSLSGLEEISLRDVFWVGGQRTALHPSLVGALFVIVNHRKRKPRMFRRKSPWEQPAYLLMRRDGSYVLASCSLEDGTIIVHPRTEGFVRPERLREGVDAQVIGQIVTVLRSLPSPP